MTFITLGSQKFQFDRLLRKIDDLIEAGVLTGPVFAQTGYSNYKPRFYTSKPFLNRKEFLKMEGEADLVITHAGTGAIIEAVKQGSTVITVPRQAKYGEHVDDHQKQIVLEFAELKYVIPCYEVDDLGECVKSASGFEVPPYVSGNARMVADIDSYLQSI